MYNYFLNIDFIYKTIFCIVSISVIQSSLEFLYLHKEFRKTGIFSWDILCTGSFIIKHKRIQFLQNILFSYKGTLAILITRLICLSAIFFIDNNTLLLICLAIVIITSLLISYRQFLGGEGSDQLNIVILISLLIGILFKSDVLIYKVSIIFIACQSCLSYISSGVAKIVGSKWRKGTAVFQIMNTTTYGDEKLAILMHKYPSISFQLSWMVIIIEILFPLCLVLPLGFCIGILIWGVLFHLYNLIFMGLNSFFWSFLATYPAIIYTNIFLKDYFLNHFHIHL